MRDDNNNETSKVQIGMLFLLGEHDLINLATKNKTKNNRR